MNDTALSGLQAIARSMEILANELHIQNQIRLLELRAKHRDAYLEGEELATQQLFTDLFPITNT